MIEEIGHKGGVVRQILAHSQSDGLTAELAVALCGLHVNAHSRGAQQEQQGDGDRDPGRATRRTAACTSSSGCLHLDARRLSTVAQKVGLAVTQTPLRRVPAPFSAVKVKARPPRGVYLRYT